MKGDIVQPKDQEKREYDLMLLLDRLESLLEDMEELGIDTREQAQAKIADLHRQLDQID